MSVIRAQVIHGHASGLARDSSVNTFHFNGIISDPNLTNIATALWNVWDDEVSAGERLTRYMSSVTTTFRVKLYDVTDEPSGPPLFDQVMGNHTIEPWSAVDLPSEVAVAVSFAGTPEAGLVQARRRGRVFLGPLNLSAINPDGGIVRVAPSLRDTAIAAFQRLATEVDPVAEWVVYSRPYEGRGEIVRPGKSTLPAIPARAGTTVNIDEVSVDNAPDTIRRRGERPTVRTTAITGE